MNRRDWLKGAALAAGTAGLGSARAQEGSPGQGPDLTGRTILITGCSSGFGRLGAEHYARLGARVFASMRDVPRPEAEALRSLAEAEGLAIEVVEIDVRTDAQVRAGVDEVLSRTGGRLDLLVNNAGIAISGPVELQDMQAMQHMFETNVFGCHRMVRAVLPAMRDAGSGHIVNVSSQLGRVIVPGLGAYSGTKFALEALSEQMAYELAPRGVDVTIIQPGGYPTEIWENGNRYTNALKDRIETARLEAYPDFADRMGNSSASPETDPMDVPRAIAEVTAMPAGQRPLRRAVHPTAIPQTGINEASAKTQVDMLGASPFGPMVKAVHKTG